MCAIALPFSCILLILPIYIYCISYIIYLCILYYTIVYYIILYYTILYYIILYYTILYYIVYYCIYLYITMHPLFGRDSPPDCQFGGTTLLLQNGQAVSVKSDVSTLQKPTGVALGSGIVGILYIYYKWVNYIYYMVVLYIYIYGWNR